MAYCGPRGIPLSVFLGRVAGPGDPVWLPEDRAAALGWQAFENRRCGRCGTHPDEWSEDQFAYHAHLTECTGCRQMQRLSATDEAKQGEGRYSILAVGPAADCSCSRPLPPD